MAARIGSAVEPQGELAQGQLGRLPRGARLAVGEAWALVFCSDMFNLAEFRGLAPALVNAGVPAILLSGD